MKKVNLKLNQTVYCLDCHKSFNEVDRFEDTNLCINCFNNALNSSDSKKQKEYPYFPNAPVFIGKANGIIEFNFINHIFQTNEIPMFYLPGSSRGIFGIEDNLNISVRKKDLNKALELLKKYNIEYHNFGAETPVTANNRYHYIQPHNMISLNYLLFFAIFFLIIFLLLLFFK